MTKHYCKIEHDVFMKILNLVYLIPDKILRKTFCFNKHKLYNILVNYRRYFQNFLIV